MFKSHLKSRFPFCHNLNVIKIKFFTGLFYFRDNLEKPDVNCLLYSKENHVIYAGCGDNKIHAINLENGKILSSLSGHTDFIHSIALS